MNYENNTTTSLRENYFFQWLTTNRQSNQRNKWLRQRYMASAEEAADFAAERLALRGDYGTIVEEAANLAQQRSQTKEGKMVAVEHMVDVISDRTTDRQTIFHLLKGNIGPGCLSLPWAFSQLGIPCGIFMTIMIALWTYSNIMTVLDVKALYTSGRRTVTYSDLGDVAYGINFRNVVTGSIVLLQMAICTVYLSFVSSNMQAFFAEFMPQYPALGESQLFNILIVLPVAIGLTLMPNLRALGLISEIAMLILFAAFGILAILLFQNADHNANAPILTQVNWLQAPMAICGILYTFEGICIVLPLEGAMKERAGFRTNFSAVYALITVLYICIGSSCVYFLGAIPDGSITAYLAGHSDEFKGYLLVTIANLLVSLAVLLSYALAMFPCIELWCQALERTDRGGTLEADEEEDDWWGGSMAYGPYDTPILRLSLLLFTVVAAVAIPNVQQLIALAGAIAGSATALIVPPLLDLRFLGPGLSCKKMLAYSFLCLGIIFGTTGTVAALYDVYKSF